MKIGEIWIMKKNIFDFHASYDSDCGEIEDTKVEILDIVDDMVYYMYLYSSETGQYTRKKFLETYEKIY